MCYTFCIDMIKYNSQQPKESDMKTKELNEFIVLNQDKDYDWIAQQTGKSVDAIRKRYTSLGLPPKRYTTQNSTPLTPEQQFELDMEKLRLSQKNKSVDKKYNVALKEITSLQNHLETVLSVKDSISTYEIKAGTKSGGEAVAFAIASDWHVEENVKPETVNGSNEYNMSIAKRRAEKFFQHTLQLLQKEQQSVKIDTLVIALLGDFFSGNIHDELLASCEVGPQDAMMFAQNLIASGIQFLLDNSKLNLVIPCSVGNHSRMTKKIHISDEHGMSLEWAMYNFLAIHFKGNKRVKFVLSRSYHTYLDVYGYKVRFHHGHAVNFGGGLGGLTIPMIKAINRWDNDQKAYLSVCGHFHQKMDGERFIVNGSLIGDSPYGKRLGFTGRPEQVFFLIDKKRGKTIVCPILVE